MDEALIRAFLDPNEAGPSMSQLDVQVGMAVGASAAFHPPAEPKAAFDSTFGTHSAPHAQESTSEEDNTCASSLWTPLLHA